jgi:multidrug efflux pump subunit AcrA (membrane-fusion protein)
LRSTFIIIGLLAVVGVETGILLTRTRTGGESAAGKGEMAMEESGSKEVSIPTERMQLLGVTFATVEQRKLEAEIRTVGRVDYDETRVTTVSTKVSGWIENLYADYTGKIVSRGEPLYTIYSPEVVSTEQEYLLSLRGESVRPRLGGKELILSAKKRLEFWDIPENHIKDLETSGSITKTMMIHSPSSGYIIKKNISEGAHVDAGQDLFVIADLSKIWVYADIYEYEIPLVSVGQGAEMILSYYAGETFSGKVNYVYPYLDEKTRTIKIRVEFDNPGLKLKPGMYANVRLRSIIADSALAIPTEAVLDTGERKIVFVQKRKGVFEPREVVLGAKAGDYYQVLSGVEAGEIVATSANFLIDSESRLGSAMMKMKM